jgi:cellulose synthase/poly-beta-1,6-N-acetylglucosamine synthase-like glycosyltransferase
MRSFTGGTVIAAPPSGPVLSPLLLRRRAIQAGTLAPLLGPVDRVVVAGLTAGWAAAIVAFWAWWLQPEHRITWFGFLLNSALILYLSLNAGYFLIACNRVRAPHPQLPFPRLRVAFAVTKAPSEPWLTARTTLEAMLAQDFPYAYDVWLCDEDPDEETARWCRRKQVVISTRRGLTDYHRPVWPRRTKCKEGNLAYFYDSWGYEDYDVVAQLDCDHVPAPTYLREMVRPFADPAVGYVAAPSVCDSNADESWSARGRTHREATFDGPCQAGHNGGLAPVCIGSHYAVRTAALRDIGGLGPELAEDFSTTFLLTSAGWEGAFAIDAEAHGEGPNTFAAMITQEFQWARSLTTVLCDLVPRHLGRLPWRLRARYLYALLYYPSLTLAMTCGILLPSIAAITGQPWVRVGYLEFLIRWCLAAVCILALTLYLRSHGLLRPTRVPVISWELWLYVLSRWPFIAWGVVAALIQKIRPRPVGFRVTPKGRAGLERLPVRLVLPYLTVTLGLSISALVGEARGNNIGYVLLCLLGATGYALVSIAVPVLHASEAARVAGVPVATGLARTAAVPLLLAGAAVIPLVTAVTSYPLSALGGALW